MEFGDQAQGALEVEGIKFLFSQAGALINWWRDRHSRRNPARSLEEADRTLSKGVLVRGDADDDLIRQVESCVQVLGQEAATQTQALEKPKDSLAHLRELQQLLKRALVADETENPEDETAQLRAALDLDLVEGTATGIRAKEIAQSIRMTAWIKAGEVSSTGSITGIDIGKVGG